MTLLEALKQRDATLALRVMKTTPSSLREKSKKGSTVLMAAAFFDVPKVVDELLRRGVDVNVARRDGQTALSFAAQAGHAKIVERLLAAGAKVDANATKAARRGDNAKCIRLLQPQRPLEDMVKTDLLAAIRKNLGGAVSAKALHAAMNAGRLDVVELLLEAGAKPSRSVAAFKRDYTGVGSLSELETAAFLRKRRVSTPLDFGTDRALLYRGATTMSSLRLDHGEYVDGPRSPIITAALIIDGDLRVTGLINNGEQDFGPLLVVLGNLDVENVAIGGAQVIVTGNMTVRGVFHGYYNHGLTTIRGNLEAGLFLPDDYSVVVKGKRP